jgi:peptide deformylase
VFCHEYDHLDGILYTDIAMDIMTVEEYSELFEKLKEEHGGDESQTEMSEIWASRK